MVVSNILKSFIWLTYWSISSHHWLHSRGYGPLYLPGDVCNLRLPYTFNHTSGYRLVDWKVSVSYFDFNCCVLVYKENKKYSSQNISINALIIAKMITKLLTLFYNQINYIWAIIVWLIPILISSIVLNGLTYIIYFIYLTFFLTYINLQIKSKNSLRQTSFEFI